MDFLIKKSHKSNKNINSKKNFRLWSDNKEIKKLSRKIIIIINEKHHFKVLILNIGNDIS